MLGIGLNAKVAIIESVQILPLVILLMGVALTLSILIKTITSIMIPIFLHYLLGKLPLQEE